MQTSSLDRRITWLTAGTLLGMVIAYYCPTEPAYADTAVISDKFAMCTVDTAPTFSEAVFILDMVTGRLMGAAYNTTTGTFTQTFIRDLAADFQVTERAQYVMVTGRGNLAIRGGGPPAIGVIYIGELNSGLCNMYGFFYTQTQQQAPLQQLTLVGQFPWRVRN